ncbi:actin [Histomonas meleagridis]|uniref:actin n=1 Tax=Histomonas meleagridis TaxID=135588 RepID=UPI00355ACB67|nr:actin [Histomonas meleagridis]KAH0802405.1 actin [Histomonas meleagridis]
MNLVKNTNQALVYDIGSASVKLGYAGDLYPLYAPPSWYAVQSLENGDIQYQFEKEWLTKCVAGLEIKPMEDENSEGLTTFLDWTYSYCFGEIEPTNWSVLFSQPTVAICNTQNAKALEDKQNHLAEIAFDFGYHPRLGFQHDSSLTCYSHGIHTGLVVDFGWSCLRAVPIIEGHPYRSGIRIHTYGGKDLSFLLYRMLTDHGKNIHTHREIIDPNAFITESQLQFCRMDLLIDMIKSNLKFDVPTENTTILDNIYFMPGKVPIDLENEMNYISNFYWEEETPLQELIKDAINATPEEYQNVLWKSIVTGGGLSNLKGFRNRLKIEVEKVAPNNIKPNVILPKCREAAGEFATWVGGSIFASSECFPSFCMTREEWTEVGSANRFI